MKPQRPAPVFRTLSGTEIQGVKKLWTNENLIVGVPSRVYTTWQCVA